ncbi:unnamed protein product [Caretta caretta]
MTNKAMKERHWNRIAETTGHQFDVESDSFCLRNIMEAPLLKHKDDIEDICISAIKEKDIEAKLSQIIESWGGQNLSFSPFKARGELLLKGAESAEIITLMEDSLMILGSLLSNRYNIPFKKDIQNWVYKLSTSSDIIEEWLVVQNLWVYLEAVFVGGDIAKQLPQLDTPVNAKGPVELWLLDLLRMQQSSLHCVIRAAYYQISDPGYQLLNFLYHFPAQVGLLGIQMLWTHDSEEALHNAKDDRKIMPVTNQKFLDILNTLISQTTHDLSSFDRVKFETLVTIHVHQRDIFDDLVKMHIKSVTDFEWLKQSRFYFKEDVDQVWVSITNVDFIYQNEFLGCTDRLVITPLTDRCYITLAQALGMNMGGAPAGPAGTGKTETTKDMGKALGKYVVVFNCSDQMDFRGLGRIFKGLAQSGSWGCFDEFNRIELPVLSVAAQQIYIILTARKERKKQFIFSDGDIVDLNPEFGIFLTMVHYDFGLRNILSVLRTLGAQKRARPDDSELSTVMRGLRDMNLSKLVDEDEPLFLSLINDLFPGLQLDSSTYAELQAAVSNQVEEIGLINHPPWNLKLIQLYETYKVRHGLMILGPSGSGKTTVITMLMKAMTECGRPHREMRMNPKAITAPQMFGKLDTATNDWTDGIFSTLWRKTLKAKKGENIFLILDGPVDAIWIENLNSVLDDNKTLTLANGDRIPMSPTCKLLFEVHNIENASPATVSRMGMVYISSSALNWRPILQAWLKKRTPQEADILQNLYDRIFEAAYTYMKLNLNPKMELLECNYIMQSINLLEGLIPSKEEGGISSPAHLHKLFAFGLMWSLGALLELDSRDKLEAFIRANDSKLDLPEIPKNTNQTMYEFHVTDYGDWQHWNKRVQEYVYPTESIPDYASILVPNVDNVRTQFLVETIAKQHKAVLLTGEQGTAKTVMIKGYLKKYDPEEHLSKSLNFSSATEPFMFQRTIESYVDKRMGSTYGPPGGRRMTVFIDDINMPIINEWGDQVTNEIVRQMMEMEGMYSLDKPGDFTTIVDVKMLPTPSKFHYIFNLRDLSRIWQGMLTIKAEECEDITTLMALFKNECNRVITDRFVNDEDVAWFDKATTKAIEEHVDPGLASILQAEPYFVDFLQDMPEPTGDEPEDFVFEAPKVYEMISRIIRTACGNALLVGVGGSGKQSLSRLASFIAGYRIFQITLTRSYNVSNLTDDLKLLYRVAGAEGKGITFIFTDNEIKDEAFLEYLNNLLSSGEVGEKFRARSLKFPGLISGCTMDWFNRWPKEALVAVASYFLSEFNIVCSSEVKAQVVETMGLFHDIVSENCENYFQRYRRRAHVTPKSYLSFINGYKDVYSEKLGNINEQAERMQIGLAKLMEASESVAKLSLELAVKEKELALASVKADKVLAEVTVSAEASAKVKNEVQGVKDKAQKIVDEIDSEKVVAETKLEAARPALEEAEAALNTIKPVDIATVRKLAKPPHLIMRIMDCCLLLFQKKIDAVTQDPEKACCKPSWGESLKLMSGPFLQSLQQFAKDSINEETVELLQPYFNMEDYTFENGKKVCGNVAGLLSWTLAMATFYGINREVLPLKSNLAKQEGRLKVANEELATAQALLDEKQAELDKVQAKFDAAMKEKMDLLNDADVCRRKMQAASALIDGLSGEKVRWTQQSKEFKTQINRLVGDVLLCTGFLSYCGPFNQIFRNLLLKDLWEVELKVRKIPFTENLNLISMLVDQPTISEWNLQGLPGDELSIQNGIIVTKATRYPLLIDPQTQGKTWIKQKEKGNELQVTTLNHKYFRTHLEDSLSLGRSLVIEDISEELDPALDNILEKNFIKSGTSFKVKVGDKEVEVMTTFKLYITTKLPNPAFTPEINAKTSVIDFTVTMKGLENQLLKRVILTEKQTQGRATVIKGLGGAETPAYEVIVTLTLGKAPPFQAMVLAAAIGEYILGIDVLRGCSVDNQYGLFAFGHPQYVSVTWVREVRVLMILQSAPHWEPVVLPPLTAVVSKRQYRLPGGEEEITQMISALLEAKIIRPILSPYNSSPWPVWKPDGTWRMTVDYRELNKVTPPLTAVMPDMVTLIERITVAALPWHAIIDLANAFFSIFIAPDSQEQFVFSWQARQYTFCVLPQGWKHSPTICHQLVSADLAHLGLPDATRCYHYIDDVMVSGPSRELVADALHTVVTGLEARGWTLNPHKIQGPTQTVVYLGIMWAGPERQIPWKVQQTVQRYPPPQTKKELQAFLGLLGFWRSLVDDESLIGVLRITKQTAAEVSEKLYVAAETQVKINTAQEEYRPAATRGSILYFLITEMSMVNNMYQTSLAQFLKLFDQSMARSEKSPLPQKRISNIIEYLTFETFTYSVRGLYEDHKFLFTLLLTLKIDLQRGQVKAKEFQALIKGGAALDLKACPPKPFRWILDMTWLNLVELSKLPQFAEIMNQISRNEKGWKSWFDKDAPEEEVIPDGYNDSLDTCRKLLLIRSWCPDRTLSQARKYIADSLEEKYTEPVILNLEKTWEESDTRTPLICFLSMGSDPTIQIDALARKLKLECRTISMGQGQEVHARKLTQMSMQQGGWVLLQNCHLGLDFMDELLETVITAEIPDETFRVWITTEPHDKFPITLLQISIKFTNEPPQGVRAGLKRTFSGINQDLLDVSNMPMWKPLLYTVAFLHSTVQERRKFGPLGWNIPYEFNSADFTASVQFIQNHLDECDIKKGISWSTVRYMIGEVQYGGRVTDDYDKRLLNCFARVWFSEKMFESTFCFYTGYKIPVCKTLDQYQEYIQTLPAMDSPEVFGLHPNANITYQSNTAASVLNTITNIQPKESGGGAGETREAIVFRLAEDMLGKLPPDYIPHEVKARLIKMGHLNSMNIFLRQEIDRMQKVITILRNSLNDLKLAIEGTIIMSENLRDALDNMYDARIPQLWKRVSWDSSTLGFWFTELLERNTQFHTWIFEGRPNVFWMTGFFNPQGFLTAMRQEATRAHKGWALDTVTIHNEVLKQSKEEITTSPAEGVYIYGLYLDGAGWDKRNSKLTEPTPKILFTILPVVHIFAVNTTGPKDPKLYVCPIYKKPRRTDLTYITVIYLRTTVSPDHWILRGVALLCDIK